jgi:hypothetical protein
MHTLRAKITKHPLYFPLIITVVYFLASLILILTHEPWNDEANPWLIAKHLSFDNFFEILRGEPHPILWTLILAPFAKLGFPLIATNIISLLIMTTSVFLFARYAPWNKVTRLLIIVSAAFFYYLPVISRDYCLVALAIVLICTSYKTRLAHPIRYTLTIALLLQSHFIVAGLAAMLYIIFLFDYLRQSPKHRKIFPLIISLTLIGATLCICFLTIIPSFANQYLIQRSLKAPPTLMSAIKYLSSINSTLFGLNLPIIELSLVFALVYFFLKFPRQFLMLLAAITFQIITITLFYQSTQHIQKNLLILLYLLLTFWTIHYHTPIRRHQKILKSLSNLASYNLAHHFGPISTIILLTPCVISIPRTLAASAYDLTTPFDLSIPLSSFINNNLPPDSIIIIPTYVNNSNYIAALPYLKDSRYFWSTYTHSQLDYIDYTIDAEDSVPFSLPDLVSTFPSTTNLYYIAPSPSTATSSCSTVPAYIYPPDDWTPLETFTLKQNPYFMSLDRDITLYQVPSAYLAPASQ